MTQAGVPEIPAAELPEGAAVLDVREPDEWTAGHIDGAVHIPLADVPARLGDLPDGDPLYVTCRGGGRSSRATEYLRTNGIEAINMAGGMQQWADAGRAMVSETGQPPQVV